MLAIGTSICGVSAIVAAKGAIRARNSDVSYAIAAILALGAVALFLLPPLGHAIGLTDREFGLWAGLAVDNTAETTATGYLFSDHAGKIAVLVKSTRNALIGFVVLGFALYWAARGQADEIAPGAKAKAAFIWDKFPKFVLGFLAVSAIATAHLLSKGQTANLANVSKWAFLLTFAGVGLNTDIRQIARTGWRPLVVSVIGLTVVAARLPGHRAAHLARIALGRKRLTFSGAARQREHRPGRRPSTAIGGQELVAAVRQSHEDAGLSLRQLAGSRPATRWHPTMSPAANDLRIDRGGLRSVRRMRQEPRARPRAIPVHSLKFVNLQDQLTDPNN